MSVAIVGRVGCCPGLVGWPRACPDTLKDVEHRPHAVTRPGRALAIGLVLTLSFAGVQLVASVWSGSLALASDAMHMLVDSAGLVLALVATLIAARPADFKRSYGYARVEVLVVPLHVLLMFGVAAYILYEAIGRAGDPPHVSAWPVLAAGAVGLIVNLVVLRLLRGHAHNNLNARGAMFEVMADALGSVGVIVAAAVILLTGWYGVDIVVSLAIAGLVLPRAVALLRQSLGILLEATPPGVSVERIERDAREIEGVEALHDLHVWSLAPSFVALSAHVEVSRMDDTEALIRDLTMLLRERHGITHVTLQPETRALHEAVACCEYPDAADNRDHAHRGAALIK